LKFNARVEDLLYTVASEEVSSLLYATPVTKLWVKKEGWLTTAQTEKWKETLVQNKNVSQFKVLLLFPCKAA
jgi:hypothetical protein